MKHGLTLKLLLKVTIVCVALTLLKFLLNRILLVHKFSHRDFELVAAWIVLGIAWIIYLVSLVRSRIKDKETEPWDRKEKDPW